MREKHAIAVALILGMMAALVTGGCSTKVEVQGSSCWDGSVNGASVAGCGTRSWEGRAGECYVFQKAGVDGWLRARVTGWKGDDRWLETRAAYGVVTVCARP